MRPGREIDTRISKEVFGYEVFVKQKVLHERTPAGDRPLRPYSKEVNWAYEVAQAMKMTMIPIEGGTWFVMVGKPEGWRSPAEFIEYLQTGNFVDSGAAVGEELPLSICIAALKAIDNRNAKNAVTDATVEMNEAQPTIQ